MEMEIKRAVDPIFIRTLSSRVEFRIKRYRDYGNRVLNLSPSEARRVAYGLLAAAEEVSGSER